jgi:hypothetical protein
MALGYRTLLALPRLHTYDDADRRERETKPIRGRTPETKPLGRRSQTHLTIKREENNDIGIYYGSGLVLRYRPNGDLLVYDQAYWNKASFNDIIREVTGLSIETFQGRAWTKTNGAWGYLRPSPRPQWVTDPFGERKWAMPDEPTPENIFRRVERHAGNSGYLEWAYVNPPTITTHKVNRRGAKAVRARYAGALAYIEALSKLRRDDHPKWDEVQQAFPERMAGIDPSRHWERRSALPAICYPHQFERTHAAELCALMASDDPVDHYRAYLWLHRDSGPAQVMPNADKVLTMHHHDEWLTKQEVETTSKTHDRYAWAVPV